jgi:hypothetical protein
MSILENNIIYDPSQGNPFASINKFLDELDERIIKLKSNCGILEKALLDVDKTGSGAEAKQLIDNTVKLTTETEKLIVVEKSKAQIETNLKAVEEIYNKAVIENTTALTNNNKAYQNTIDKMTNLRKDVDDLNRLLISAKKNVSANADSTDMWAKEVSDLTVKLEIQKKELKDATLLAKNLEIVNRSETETIQSLKAQLSASTIAWNKLTAAKIQDSEEGKNLQADMKATSEALRMLEMDRGSSGRNVGKYAQSLKGLKLELKELKGTMMSVEEGSVEYNAALQRSAYITDELGDMNARVKGTAMDFEGVMGNVSKVTQGAASMFEIAQGAEALFGIESEDLAKTLVKVQAAMAIANGLQGLDGLGKSFKNLLTQIKIFSQGVNKALAATVIGAFIAALITVVSYWDDIKEAMFGVSEEQRKLNEGAKANAETEKKKLELLDSQDNILKLQGKSEKDILKLKIQQLDKNVEASEEQIASMIKITELQVKAEERNQKILMKAMEPTTFVLNLINDALRAMGELIGQDWDLGLGDLSKKITKQFFDPEETAKKGKESIEEAEKILLDYKNKRAGYQIEINNIDKKGYEEGQKIAKEKAEEDKKILLEKLQDQRERAASLKSLEDEAYAASAKQESDALEESQKATQAEWDMAMEAYERDKELKDKKLEEQKKRDEDLKQSITSAATSAGEEIGRLMAAGELSFKNFSKVLLLTALDAIQRELLLIQVQILSKEIASKSFAGIATSAILIGIISASFAAAKAKVSSFAVGTDYLTGKKDGPSGGILIEGHEGEMILTAKETAKITGVSHEDVPDLVHAGLQFYKMESILSDVRNNSKMTNEYLSRNELHWTEGKWELMKDIRTNKIYRKLKR